MTLLPGLVAQLKACSKNPAVPVLLGGAALVDSALTPQDLGADGMSNDAVEAVALASLLLQRRSFFPALEYAGTCRNTQADKREWKHAMCRAPVSYLQQNRF